MAKIKLAVKTPTIDMTPMVDLFFLLLTFFMLTTTFRPQEAVQVDTPNSISEKTTPEKRIITIIVSKDNKVFYNVDNGADSSEHIRAKLLESIAGEYNVKFSPKEIKKFEGLASFGFPVGQLRNWINADTKERDAMQVGIPYDSTDNQLSMWIYHTRKINKDLQVAIKGDGNADYKVVRRIIDILQDNNVNSFNLTTNLEKVEVKMDN